MAAAIVAQSTGEAPPEPDPDEGKNPAAVKLGRLGGKKGGKARASRLTSEETSAAASRAARARWSQSQ